MLGLLARLKNPAPLPVLELLVQLKNPAPLPGPGFGVHGPWWLRFLYKKKRAKSLAKKMQTAAGPN
ncbi:MAG: hypothetical protein CMF46_00110 [Legionellales bacterium]|nr:hypothetical protein [Legionellales bacterium]